MRKLLLLLLFIAGSAWAQTPSVKSIPVTQKGAASGVATLDGSAKLTSTQKPALAYTDITSANAVISGTVIDWTAGRVRSKTLSADTTFTFTNTTPLVGVPITVFITNTASNWTVTWPTIKWVGGAAPVQTVGVKTDIYVFIYDGSSYYGSYSQNHF